MTIECLRTEAMLKGGGGWDRNKVTDCATSELHGGHFDTPGFGLAAHRSRNGFVGVYSPNLLSPNLPSSFDERFVMKETLLTTTPSAKRKTTRSNQKEGGGWGGALVASGPNSTIYQVVLKIRAYGF